MTENKTESRENTSTGRVFSPVSFETEPKVELDYGSIETAYIPFWLSPDGAFNVPPNLAKKTLVLRLVRKTGGDIKHFFFMPEGPDDEVKNSELGKLYRLYSIPVRVFPLLPNAESKRAGLFIGMQQIETNSTLTTRAMRVQALNEDIAVAVRLADETQKHISVRIVYVPDIRFPEKTYPRLAGGDFIKGETIQPSLSDAARVPVSDQKARMVAGMDQSGFFEFLQRTKKMVDVPLDEARQIDVVQDVCNAATTR
jgi:hypothetical protein